MRRRETKKITCFIAIAAMLAAWPGVCVSALAQMANTGVITGVAKDPTGAVIVGAKVKVTNRATGVSRMTMTNEAGAYELAQLVPSDYRLEVDQAGFNKFVHDPVTVNVLSRVTVDPEMKPSGAAEQVTVMSEPISLIETTKTDLTGVVDKREMEFFPVNGRSFASLAPLVPGATPQPSFDPVKARTGTFSVGGSTGRNLNVVVDGGDNKDNHVGGTLQNYTMEGIQEFALSTQRFSAANGRSGGALLSVITKSGANEFHGSMFGFFRDDHFNANASRLLADANPNLFEEGDRIKAPFSRQQFGASAGGALEKNHAFWFAAVEQTRERGSSVVPSFAFDQIKSLEPLGYEAVRFLPQPFDDTQYMVKGDFYPGASGKHSLMLRYAGQQNRSHNDQAGFLTVFTDLSGGNKQTSGLNSLLGSWTWIANASTINQFLYQWSSFDDQLISTTNLPQLSFPDGVAVGQNEHVPEHTFQRKHQLRDDLTWNKGSHAIKVGADFVLEPKIGGFDAAESTPIYKFNFTIDQIVHHRDQFPNGFFTSQVRPGPITGSPDEVKGVGVVAEILLAGGDPHFDLRDGAKQFSWYVQDDWKVSERLTLNLGVRYDLDIGYVDSGHQQDNRAFKLFQIIGHPLGSRLAQDDRNNFSPRIGFAWDITGNERVVLRGGYGLYYDQSFLDVPRHAIQQANSEIFALVLNDTPNLSLGSAPPVFPRPLMNPPIGFGEITTGSLIDPNFASPYTQQMNIGLARQIGANMAIEIDYVHILGLHEFTETDVNPGIGPLIGANRNSPTPQRLLDRAFAAHAGQITSAFGQAVPFGAINVIQTDGRSRYDALTVSFKKSYSRHFQLSAHYTLSRALAWFGPIADFEATPQNPFNKFDARSEFGHPGEDERHRFVLSGIVDLPLGLQVSSIFQLASARPYSVFPDPGAGAGGDINQDGNFNDREARDGDDQRHLPPGSERGDNFAQLNLRVSKYMKLGDKKKLGLFFEAFNLFNTGNFGNSFDGTVGSPNFKRPVNFFGATGFSEPLGIPFQAQFGFRLSF
jgi:Carboxypeptidase regulatory-like domain/TonB dependent receptor